MVGMMNVSVPLSQDASFHQKVTLEKRLKIGEVILRFSMLALALVAAICVGTDTQTCTIFTIEKKAKFSDMKALVYKYASHCVLHGQTITGDALLVKFERIKDDLFQSLQRLEVLVPDSLARQIAEIFKELEKTKFALEPSEKEIGDSVITLLRQNKDPSGLNDISELETFHHAAMRLGIVSSRAVSIEKRGLKRQLHKSRCEEDKRKESIIFYLLHLLRKYNKLFRNSSMDDDSQNLDTCSQSIRNSVEEANLNGRKSDQHESKLHSLDLETRKTAGSSIGMLPGLPEEFRCPISLQLMSDPVIISSGQTYERVCIEKWFSEGHDMCPKTQQKLSYLGVTPNYCVKGLIASWCEKHGIKVPEPPSPPILPLTYWRWDQSGSIKCIDDGWLKRVKVGPLEDPKVTSFDEGDMGRISTPSLGNNNILELPIMHLNRHSVQNSGVDLSMPHDIVDSEKIEDSSRKYERLLTNLNTPCLQLQCAAAEEARILSKDDNEARSYMGANHFIPALVSFLRSAIDASDTKAQETGALALFNIVVDNNRNKASMLSSGILPLLLVLLDSGRAEAAVAVLLVLSSCDDNKASIGSSGTIPPLIELLDSDSYQCRQDALNTLYNLSTYVGNKSRMVSAGAVWKIVQLLGAGEVDCTEICISICYNLVVVEEGREAIAETDGCIVAIAELLDTGTPKQQEQAAATLLLLCTNSSQHCQLVLQEGVIPSLVTLSVNGSSWGRDKAQKLQHFREQRQRDSSWLSTSPKVVVCNTEAASMNPENLSKGGKRRLCKTTSRKIGRTLSFFWKSKSFVMYQC